MKSLKLLIKEERRHFMKCKCGEYFDMRDLKQVLSHLHKSMESDKYETSQNQDGYNYPIPSAQPN